MRITWLGHSTVLLELDGARVLTDPALRPRIAHLRRTAPVDLGGLGEIDAVLVSHAHYDHLDLPTLARIGRGVPVVVPRGAGSLLRRHRFLDVLEVEPGQVASVGPVRIVATHAEHVGTRPFTMRARALGYLALGSQRAYFAGDTGLFAGMRSLADDLDVALLPVAGWGPRLPQGHLDPAAAASALRLLRPRVAIPIHWGAYRRLGLRHDPATLREPAESFALLASRIAPGVDVRVLSIGDSVEVFAEPSATLSIAARGAPS